MYGWSFVKAQFLCPYVQNLKRLHLFCLLFASCCSLKQLIISCLPLHVYRIIESQITYFGKSLQDFQVLTLPSPPLNFICLSLYDFNLYFIKVSVFCSQQLLIFLAMIPPSRAIEINLFTCFQILHKDLDISIGKHERKLSSMQFSDNSQWTWQETVLGNIARRPILKGRIVYLHFLVIFHLLLRFQTGDCRCPDLSVR